MKILHLADLHIDADFSSENIELKSYVRFEKFKMLDKINLYMSDNNIQMLILAGDIYDSLKPEARIIYAFNDFLKKILDKGVEVVLVNGNHDYWLDEKHFSHLLHYKNFKPIIHDIKTELNLKVLDEELVIHACGYDIRNPNKRSINCYSPKKDSKIHIGVMHGVIDGNYDLDKKPYLPMSKNEVEYLNYDYFALGHVHRELDITKRCMYSGGFYPRYFGDYASYGGVLIELNSNGYIKTNRVKFSNVEFTEIDIIIRAENKKELLEKCLDNLYKNSYSYDNVNIYRLNIKAELGFLWNYLDEKWLVSEVFGDRKYDCIKMNLDCVYQEISISSKLNNELKISYMELVDKIISEDVEIKTLTLRNQFVDDLKKSQNQILTELYEYIERG